MLVNVVLEINLEKRFFYLYADLFIYFYFKRNYFA